MIKCHNNKAEMYSMIFKTLTANLEWYFAHDNYLLFLLYAVNILSTKNGQLQVANVTIPKYFQPEKINFFYDKKLENKHLEKSHVGSHNG